MKPLEIIRSRIFFFCRSNSVLAFLVSCFFMAVFVPGSGVVLAEELGQAERETSNTEAYPRFELDEVVVTSTPIQEPVKAIPRHVTVITSEDIEQAPSNNVVELLAREANVNLKSFFGHDKQAGIDIRGMGETSVSNVIVMVDGFRLNPPDLAGVDFASVSLEQIERIEIVRGAASVVYGDGAVGGVVNIIMKKGKREPEARLYSAYGTDETFDERASYGGQVEDFDFNINGTYYDSDGYRDNGFLEKKDAAARFGYDLNDYVRASLSASYHHDEYGLPGNVPIEDIDSRSRRKETDRPDDFGETVDRRVMGSLDTDLVEWGFFKINGAYRQRDNDFILGYTPLKSKSNQTSKIDEETKSLDVKYVKEYGLWGLEHDFQAGLDYYQTDYISARIDQKRRHNSDVYSLGCFFTNRLSLSEDLTAHVGYRYNIYEGTFRVDDLERFGSVDRWVNGDEFDENWHNSAYDIGAVYSLTHDTSFFASCAMSFRIPNVDELALPGDNLEPQEGRHIDVGIRHRIEALAEVSLTLFHIEIEDEIFFDADKNVNRSFDEKTKRQGIEVDVKAYPTDALYLWGNYTYMTARFDESDSFVPLVPRYQASVGVEWQVFDPLLLAVTGTFVGSRYDGNDLDNDTFAKIDAYEVFDVKLTYTHNGLKFFAGANNIFDELYETLAFSESYFTMPTRSFYGGIEWVF
ncbi:MAG: TonB-dependent receptor [Thermodesulfobacteriota bacterium]|nr:TonB-dependent receptor [Thermodesulfobacteriota bacterium]